MDFLQAIVLAVIEGLTEFLPVSSTGHMIVAASAMHITGEAFPKLFIVAIQLGAILSVVALYWRRFLQNFSFYYKLIVAAVPAVIIYVLFHKLIDRALGNAYVVAVMFILGGIIFLFVDDWFKVNPDEALKDESKPGFLDRAFQNVPLLRDGVGEWVGYTQAFVIGLFQSIALIPGVSRSAATIIGGLTQNLTRKTAAEFSFFLAVPMMFGATAVKLLKFFKDGNTLEGNQLTLLIVGNIVAFIVAALAIRTFIQYLTKHGFKVFGYYRIIVGVLILILLATGWMNAELMD